MVIVFMALIMTERMTAVIALIAVPVVFALLAGCTTEIGTMAFAGTLVIVRGNSPKILDERHLLS